MCGHSRVSPTAVVFISHSGPRDAQRRKGCSTIYIPNVPTRECTRASALIPVRAPIAASIQGNWTSEDIKPDPAPAAAPASAGAAVPPSATPPATGSRLTDPNARHDWTRLQLLNGHQREIGEVMLEQKHDDGDDRTSFAPIGYARFMRLARLAFPPPSPAPAAADAAPGALVRGERRGSGASDASGRGRSGVGASSFRMQNNQLFGDDDPAAAPDRGAPSTAASDQTEDRKAADPSDHELRVADFRDAFSRFKARGSTARSDIRPGRHRVYALKGSVLLRLLHEQKTRYVCSHTHSAPHGVFHSLRRSPPSRRKTSSTSPPTRSASRSTASVWLRPASHG